MPMYETDILCPICQYPLTDVDGMLDCQNPKYDKESGHFVYFDTGDEENFFNFKAWGKIISDKESIIKRIESK
jgi:hypothetical protein